MQTSPPHSAGDPQRVLWITLLLVVAVGLPIVTVLAAAAHFWSTAGKIGIYRPEEPSRLYAAPLTLRKGAPFDHSGLAADLESLGYRPVSRDVGRSEFQLDAHRLRIGLKQSATIERSWLSLQERGPAAVVVDADLLGDRFGSLRV